MKIYSTLLLIALFSFGLFSQSKWDYPIKPGTEKWKSFQTYSEMVEACKIPENIIKKMTTEELLEAYDKYPLKWIYLSFNSPIKGFEEQIASSSALKELLQRKDAGNVVLKKYKTMKADEKEILALKNKNISTNDYFLYKLLLSREEISSKISEKDDVDFIKKETLPVKQLQRSRSNSFTTPRGTPYSYYIRSDGPDDPFEPYSFDVAGTDANFISLFPNATFLSSSTRTYNCHAYAWADGYNTRIWINSPEEEKFWTDGSYETVAQEYATHIKYSGDHSALQVSNGIYNSKWGKAPLFRHAKNYCPDIYGSPAGFYYTSIDVPIDMLTINTAYTQGVDGQTINFTGTETFSSNLEITSGINLILKSGSTLNLNGYYLYNSGSGNIQVESGAIINCVYLKEGGQIKGIFPTIQSAVNYSTANQTVELQPRTYQESFTVTGKNNLIITGAGQNSTTVVYGTSFTNSSYSYIENMTIASVLLNNCNNISVENISFTAAGMVTNFNGSLNRMQFCSNTNGGAAFGFTAYGGSGDVSDSYIYNFDAGVYISAGSFNVTYNYFCGNGYDIYTSNGGYGYANSNQYSRSLPGAVYGNVFTTGVNSVCSANRSSSGLTKNANESNYNTASDSLEAQFLALLNNHKDIYKTSSKESAGLAPSINSLINTVSSKLPNVKDKSAFKRNVDFLFQLYSSVNKKGDFYATISSMLNNSRYNTYSLILKKYNIQQLVDQKNYTGALSVADNILSAEKTDTALICEALYEKGLVNKYFLKDNEKASEAFRQITFNYKNNILSKFAENELGDVSLGKEIAVKNTSQPDSKELILNNYPNPFNPATKINFSIPQPSNVKLTVYNVLGQKIVDLVDEFKDKGNYTINFNASNLSSGIYITVLRAGSKSISNKIFLVK